MELADAASLQGIVCMVLTGVIAGWLAEQVMRTELGLVMNTALGILGGLLSNAILIFGFGLALFGWQLQAVVSAIGACILIGAVNAVFNRA